MSDDWKNDRLEAEIAKREMELIRNAHLNKLKSASIDERIKYIITHTERTDWTSEDMLEELVNHQLDEGVRLAEISEVLKKS